MSSYNKQIPPPSLLPHRTLPPCLRVSVALSTRTHGGRHRSRDLAGAPLLDSGTLLPACQPTIRRPPGGGGAATRPLCPKTSTTCLGYTDSSTWPTRPPGRPNSVRPSETHLPQLTPACPPGVSPAERPHPRPKEVQQPRPEGVQPVPTSPPVREVAGIPLQFSNPGPSLGRPGAWLSIPSLGPKSSAAVQGGAALWACHPSMPRRIRGQHVYSAPTILGREPVDESCRGWPGVAG